MSDNKEASVLKSKDLSIKRPSYYSYLPGLALVSAGTFLAGGTYLGLRIGLTKAMSDSTDNLSMSEPSSKSPTTADARSAFHFRLPNGNGMTAGQLGAKALGYGTLLCLTGSSIIGLGVCWYLDTWSLDAFARKMEKTLPHARAVLEGGLSTPVSSFVLFCFD